MYGETTDLNDDKLDFFLRYIACFVKTTNLICSKNRLETDNNVYKLNLMHFWTLQEVEKMSQKKNARHTSNCQIAADASAVITQSSATNVPTQKRKEDADQILYINRI